MPAENGFVPTPEVVADYAASVAFGAIRPTEVEDGGRLLLPGLGTGRLYDAVQRYCTEGEGWYSNRSWDYPIPECVGVENDPARINEFQDAHPDADLTIYEADFPLDLPAGSFDWVLMNPPFMRYSRLDPDVREQYADRYWAATGQFGLHAPFVEAALECLRPGGELTTFPPIAVLVSGKDERLRTLMRTHASDPMLGLPDATFDVKIETVLITLKRNPGGAPDGNVYLADLYAPELREMLHGLDVNDVGEAVEQYYSEQKLKRRLVRNTDRRDRNVTIVEEDGSHRVKREGRAEERQGNLGEWSL